jgi:hypothetical protein
MLIARASRRSGNTETERRERSRRAAFAFAVRLIAVSAMAVALAGCGGAVAPADESPFPAGPPNGVTARLADSVKTVGSGRIAWSTRWSLCWKSVPGAGAYELQTLAGEGTSPETVRQSGTCFSLEVAKGENARSAGLVNRDLQIALARGQLSYRVRAVAGKSVSAWTAAYAAGAAAP